MRKNINLYQKYALKIDKFKKKTAKENRTRNSETPILSYFTYIF
jgi:hypothetical protein